MSSLGPGRSPEPYAPSQYGYAAPTYTEVRPTAPWGTSGPPVPATPLWAAPRNRRSWSVGGAIVLVVLGIITLVSVGTIAQTTGVDGALVGSAVALIPLVGVLLGIRWVDRWEPEPRFALLFALLWGAGVSTLVSLIINTAAAMALYANTGDVTAAETTAAVVVAPLVEETAKGLGVLVLLWTRRRYFDGPVDGIVYAATVAAGFAFVENILYFGRSLDFLPAVFAMRGVMSPFAHVLFTAAIGVALGLAARSRWRGAWIVAFPVGWVVAVALHAWWNGSASTENFLPLYIVFQVPLFIGVVLLVLWLRRQERKVLTARLAEYGRAGWFTPGELSMLTSFSARRQAQSWAKSLGGTAGSAMKSFQRSATRLAFARQQAASGRAGVRLAEDERALLQRITADRQEFLGAAAVRGR
ncbi:PrsW family intramembrane metalloprotease [Georgenia faecalis]|uniref:PrsW family intramembrane metalloprotease n=1 Tax=Georgenia faecalis TaxID=2483799 RepID=UPI000FD7173A|nr:PrsW family intramembrane metalloprotease [Georgenia faecalis]